MSFFNIKKGLVNDKKINHMLLQMSTITQKMLLQMSIITQKKPHGGRLKDVALLIGVSMEKLVIRMRCIETCFHVCAGPGLFLPPIARGSGWFNKK